MLQAAVAGARGINIGNEVMTKTGENMSIGIHNIRRIASQSIVAVTLLVGHAGMGAAEPISGKFDGTYVGNGEIVSPLSRDACPVPAEVRIEIDNGIIKGRVPARGAKIDGFVTSDGFFTGNYRQRDGTIHKFEGSIEDNSLIGGLFVEDGCAWLLTLAQQG